MADDLQELAAVDVTARDRNPGALSRVRRARETFAPGTLLPHVQALLRPGLFRERADTNSLLDSVFADDGALAALGAENPDLVAALRDQAGTPMSPGQHEKLRSVILGLVGDQVEKEGQIRAQVADNQAFMQAFSVLDGAIPGITDPKRNTLEESERRQVQVLFNQAQELALIDPDASKAIMTEVRKKADNLTANVRQHIEQQRKRAELEDIELFSSSDNALQLLNDASADYARAVASDKDIPDFVVEKMIKAYGAASAVAAPNLTDAAAAAISGAASGGVEGSGGKGALQGTLVGAAVGAVVTGVAGTVEYFKDKKKVKQLAEYLETSKAQIRQNYAANRGKLQERYAPLGIQFGEQQGEVYAVVNDAYKAEAGKIPSKASTPESEQADRTEALRTMLESEQASADAAVEKYRPDAAANLPGAAQKLAAALARKQTAEDDLAIFEDDLRQAAGKDLTDIPGVEVADAEKAISLARARRKNRSDAATRASIRNGIMESLRSHTR